MKKRNLLIVDRVDNIISRKFPISIRPIRCCRHPCEAFGAARSHLFQSNVQAPRSSSIIIKSGAPLQRNRVARGGEQRCWTHSHASAPYQRVDNFIFIVCRSQICCATMFAHRHIISTAVPRLRCTTKTFSQTFPIVAYTGLAVWCSVLVLKCLRCEKCSKSNCSIASMCVCAATRLIFPMARTTSRPYTKRCGHCRR